MVRGCSAIGFGSDRGDGQARRPEAVLGEAQEATSREYNAKPTEGRRYSTRGRSDVSGFAFIAVRAFSPRAIQRRRAQAGLR